MHVVVVVLVRRMVVSSQYDDKVFVSVYLCLGDSNEQSIYDQRQEIKTMVVCCRTRVKGILVIIVISNV